jgi:hypothetical protein
MDRGKILVIVIFTVPTFIALLFITVWLNNFPDTISLSFGEGNALSYSVLEGKLNLILSQENSNKILHINSLLGNTDFSTSSSNFFEISSHRMLGSNELTFTNLALQPTTNASISSSKDIRISLGNPDPGLYYGLLIITTAESKTFVPMNIETNANFARVVIWIVDGIALSIVIWNVIGYYFLYRKDQQARYETKMFAENSFRTKDRSICAKQPEIKGSLDEIISKLQNSRVNSARRELENLKNKYPEVNSELNKNRRYTQAELGQLRNYGSGAYNDTIQRLDNKETAFKLRNYLTTEILEKNVVSGFTAVAFGLIVGFIPLLQSEYINNLRTLGLTDILILVGLGVGVGNLNEAISKVWEKSSTRD